MRLLLRPVRSLLLIGAAFLAGMIYEKTEAVKRCDAHGGQLEKGICQ